MIISLRSKHNFNKSGTLKFRNSNTHFTLTCGVQGENKIFLRELQKLILRHFDVKLFAAKKITSNVILKEIRDTQDFKRQHKRMGVKNGNKNIKGFKV